MTTTIRAELAVYRVGTTDQHVPLPKMIVESCRIPAGSVRLTIPGAEPIEVSREDLEAALTATRVVR